MDIDAIRQLTDMLYAIILSLAIGSARLIGVMTIFPVFNRVQIGQILKGGIAVSLALPIYPAISMQLTAMDVGGVGYALLALKEVAVGAVFGLILGVPFWAIQAVGEIIDTQRDIAAEGSEDPSTKSQASTMAALLGFTAAVIFVSSGGLQQLSQVYYESFAFWPLARFMPDLSGMGVSSVVTILQEIMFFGLLTAAPVVALLLISDLSIMALSKVAPQIATHTLSPLLKNVLFAVFVVLYMQYLFTYMIDGFPGVVVWLERLTRLVPL